MKKIIWLLKNMHKVPRHESNECNCILNIYFKKLGLPKNLTFVDQILNELQHFHPQSCSTFGLKENMPFILFFYFMWASKAQSSFHTNDRHNEHKTVRTFKQNVTTYTCKIHWMETLTDREGRTLYSPNPDR